MLLACLTQISWLTICSENTLDAFPSLWARDQIYHPYKIIGKIYWFFKGLWQSLIDFTNRVRPGLIPVHVNSNFQSYEIDSTTKHVGGISKNYNLITLSFAVKMNYCEIRYY